MDCLVGVQIFLQLVRHVKHHVVHELLLFVWEEDLFLLTVRETDWFFTYLSSLVKVKSLRLRWIIRLIAAWLFWIYRLWSLLLMFQKRTFELSRGSWSHGWCKSAPIRSVVVAVNVMASLIQSTLRMVHHAELTGVAHRLLRLSYHLLLSVEVRRHRWILHLGTAG